MVAAPERLGLAAFGRMLRTFTLVCLGWVLFRASSLSDAVAIFQRLGTGIFQPHSWWELLRLLSEQWPLWSAVVGLLVIEWTGRPQWIPNWLGLKPGPLRWLVYTTLFWITLLFGTQQTAEFIYFQF
jgi:hypothetical protein